MVGVYTITNVINKKLYVGSAALSFKIRSRNHLRSLKNNKHSNKYLQADFNTYGESSFEFEMIHECAKEDCLGFELYWINLLNTTDRNYGYNIRSNAYSSIGYRYTDEQKQNISKSLIGKMAKEKHPMWGKKRLPTWTGRKHTDESKAKMKLSWRNKPPSESAIKKEKYILERKKRFILNKIIYCYNLQGVFIKEYPSLKDAEFDTKVTSSSIINSMKEVTGTAGGYRWRLLRDNPPSKLDKLPPKGNRIPVLQYDLEGNFIKEYASGEEASRETKIWQSQIFGCCYGKFKSAKSFLWKFKNKDGLSHTQNLNLNNERQNRNYRL